MSLLFCCGAGFCFFGSLFVLLIFFFFYTFENKNKISLKNCPRTVGCSKSVLDLHPEFVCGSLSACCW